VALGRRAGGGKVNTIVDDYHIFHTNIPEGRQPNDRFAHETSWFDHCPLCTELIWGSA
jgi:hypothetical protein